MKSIRLQKKSNKHFICIYVAKRAEIKCRLSGWPFHINCIRSGPLCAVCKPQLYMDNHQSDDQYPVKTSKKAATVLFKMPLKRAKFSPRTHKKSQKKHLNGNRNKPNPTALLNSLFFCGGQKEGSRNADNSSGKYQYNHICHTFALSHRNV